MTSDEILAEIHTKRWIFSKTRSPIDSIRSSLDAAFIPNKGIGSVNTCCYPALEDCSLEN